MSLAWVFARYAAAWIFTLWVSVSACLICLLVGPTRMWMIVARSWGKGTLWLLGVRLDIVGAEYLRGPAVFIANHQSLIDVVFMPAILPRTVRFVAKRELLWVPFWGWAFGVGGAVLIDRKRPREAMQNIRKGLKRLPGGWSIIVFPEGTRSVDGKVQPFKKGAFLVATETKLPVVPIGMEGARDVVAPGEWLVRGGVVHVNVGAPIPTQDWNLDSIESAVQLSQAAVEQCVVAASQRRLNMSTRLSDDSESIVV